MFPTFIDADETDSIFFILRKTKYHLVKEEDNKQIMKKKKKNETGYTLPHAIINNIAQMKSTGMAYLSSLLVIIIK